jgi:two-component system OmpR family sensor kinase
MPGPYTNQQGAQSGSVPFTTTQRLPSLRQRFVFWNVLTLFVTLFCLCGVTYFLVSQSLMTTLDNHLEIQSEQLQTTTRLWLSSGQSKNEAFFQQLVNGTQQGNYSSDPFSVDVHNVRNVLLPHSFHTGTMYLPLNQHAFDAALHGQRTITSATDPRGQSVHIITFPLLDLAHQTIAVAQVGRTLVSIMTIQNHLLFYFAFGSLAAMCILCVVSYLLSTSELRLLDNLGVTMQQFHVSDPGKHLLRRQSTVELQRVADTFNYLSERLSASFSLQRRFAADISHQIRTPLTTIQGLVDILLMRSDVPPEIVADLQVIRAETGKLSRLVGNLLTMTRAEVGILPQVSAQHASLVALDSLLTEIVRQLGSLPRGITLRLVTLLPLVIEGDADLLKQMLFNVLDSLLLDVQDGATVTIDLTTTEISALLPTASPTRAGSLIALGYTGASIVPEEMAHVFSLPDHALFDADPNVDSARNVRLATARLIARAHGGDITVTSDPQQGSCFWIWLPAERER